MKLIVNLATTPMTPVDFYVISQDEYNKLPNATIFHQWYGTNLGAVVDLPNGDKWYIVVANRTHVPVAVQGSYSYGAI